MRICLLADGPSIHTQRWARYFIQRGYEVHLISFRPDGTEGLTFHLIEKKTGLQDLDYLLKLSRVRALIKKIRPDIVNAHYLTSYGYLAIRSSFHPLVVSAWGSDVLVTPRKSPIHRLITSAVLKGADLITCDSQAIASHMIRLGAPQNRIVVVPQGIDPNIFFPPPSETRRANMLLSVREHKPVYNIDTVIKAVKEVREAGEMVDLVITGDGSLRSKLEELATRLDLSGHTAFLGRVAHADLADLYRRSTMFISVPSSDATSVSLLEAMATGSFPIVSDIPANREWIEDHKNGILVPPRGVSALSRAILEALENDKLRILARDINLGIIQEKAIWEKNMELVESKFEELYQRHTIERGHEMSS